MSGWNPRFGRDANRPPGGLSMAGPEFAGVHLPYAAPVWPPMGPTAYPPVFAPVVAYPITPGPVPMTLPVGAQPNGTFNYSRVNTAHPNPNASIPAAQMTNSTGGMGCEPGYNYFFPSEHTKIHVFRCSTPPWQLPPHTRLEFHAAHVPCNTMLAEILKGFGATNPNPKKNKCYEVTPGGNGKWYKGMSFSGDDKDMLKKTIKDVGWDSTRTGQRGGKPIVCLWLTNN